MKSIYSRSKIKCPVYWKSGVEVVLCFSVTKWIHFAKGDLGIHNLFKRCFKRTRCSFHVANSSLRPLGRPGGYFVLEPQEWGSYKKKRHLTREIRETVKGIQIRPEDFEGYLEQLGFERVDVIEPPGAAGLKKDIRATLNTKPRR